MAEGFRWYLAYREDGEDEANLMAIEAKSLDRAEELMKTGSWPVGKRIVVREATREEIKELGLD